MHTTMSLHRRNLLSGRATSLRLTRSSSAATPSSPSSRRSSAPASKLRASISGLVRGRSAGGAVNGASGQEFQYDQEEFPLGEEELYGSPGYGSPTPSYDYDDDVDDMGGSPSGTNGSRRGFLKKIPSRPKAVPLRRSTSMPASLLDAGLGEPYGGRGGEGMDGVGPDEPKHRMAEDNNDVRRFKTSKGVVWSTGTSWGSVGGEGPPGGLDGGGGSRSRSRSTGRLNLRRTKSFSHSSSKSSSVGSKLRGGGRLASMNDKISQKVRKTSSSGLGQDPIQVRRPNGGEGSAFC